MNDGLLRCPHCQSPLTLEDRAVTCPAGHAFDVARQGYINLVAGRPVHTGDTSQMLDARSAVLDAGHLQVVTDAVIAACTDPPLPAGALVEVGAGTAHHLAAVLRSLPPRAAVATDVSVPAARRAAKAHPAITSVVANVWEPWPLLDAVAGGVLAIFAPRNFAEAARVLTPGGLMVVVTPADDHLTELVGPLGLLGVEGDKLARLEADAAPHLDPVDVTEVRAVRRVDREAARAIAGMGPSGHHLSAEELSERAARLPEHLEVTVSVAVSRFRAT